MAWIKIPKEHHPIFMEALPRAPDVDTIPMFGGICATVNGNIAAGLFGLSAMVRLGDADRASVLEDGGSPFDPMGRGQMRDDKVMLPERVMTDGSLGSWLERAIAFTRTLPPKAKKAKGAGGSTKKAVPAAKAAPAAKTAPKKASLGAAKPVKKARKDAKKAAAKKAPAQKGSKR